MKIETRDVTRPILLRLWSLPDTNLRIIFSNTSAVMLCVFSMRCLESELNARFVNTFLF